jgi:hypothetical protein
MTDNANITEVVPTTLDQLGKTMGWDAPRYWANNLQVFVADDHALFVFREQLTVDATPADDPDSGPLPPFEVRKSVASIIMPVSVAKEVREVMNKLFPEQEATTA